MASVHSSPRTASSKLGLVAGATVLAALVAFVAGRFTADAAPSRDEGRGARAGGAAAIEPGWAAEPARRFERRDAEPLQAAAPTPQATAVQAAAPGVIPPPGASTAAVAAATAQAATETRQQLEAVRQDLVDRCWPAGGLPGGRTSARLTFSVAYDAYGREVGRGVSDERRAPTGELRKCVGRQPLGALRVSPPGTSVSVKVALNLP